MENKVNNWVFLTEIDPDPDDHNEEENEIRNRIRRVYGLDGQQWPRLLLDVYVDSVFYGAIVIHCSTKRKPGQWWNGLPGVPTQLRDDLIKMLLSDCPGCKTRDGHTCPVHD